MSEIEEANKKIRKLGNFHDNSVNEYFIKILLMNQAIEPIRYLIDMLTRRGVEESQSATTFENLRTRVSPIVRAVNFVIHVLLDTDFQDEYPNKNVDIYSREYLNKELKHVDAYNELINMRFDFSMVVGSKAESAMYILDTADDKPLDIVKSLLVDVFEDVHAMTMQKLHRVESL